jgi:hypothetical protein
LNYHQKGQTEGIGYSQAALAEVWIVDIKVKHEM